ncbi:MAG TPA: hypothetical protein VMR46_01035 [Candidatus Paceibacterota bacterium]|jgi:hypothetical protein|nr:hypothetical protein [Candidatus Paceibacterota bacterium]
MQENTGHSQNNNQGGQQSQGQKSSLSWSQPIVPASTASNVPPSVTSVPRSTAPVAPQTKSYTGTYTSIFIAGIIIGALVGWGIAGSHRGTPAMVATSTEMAATSTSSATSQNTTAPTLGTTDMSGDFVVSSPQASGFAVAVSRVVVSQPTWVVVYEDHAGVPGNALGAELFLPQSGNAAQSGTVELLRGTLPGLTYLAGEALDDGDKIFSLASDKPVRDAQGNPVLVEFTTN